MIVDVPDGKNFNHPPAPENVMTVCPVALAVGCKKCPVFSVCPLKGTLGDYVPDKEPETKNKQ